MAFIKRDLSVQFSTQFFKGISHEMIIDQLKETIDLDQVKSVQLTENSCIVSVEDSETKDKLIINGLTLKNRSVSFLDVEKTITNVTIKDMPYEVQNCFVATQMLRYGQVIPESVRRGYIKGTNIENGSRYLQMLKCDKTLPNKTNFGRFEVRIFADNNRTECKYCRTTDHPSYLYRDKPARVVLATTVIKWYTLLETVTLSLFNLSASKVVTLEIIVNNILLKRHDAIMGVMPRKS